MRGGEIPWWARSGGLLSIGLTLTGLTLAQKLGSGLYTGLTLTASLLASIALDHFGLAGFKPHSVTSLRGAGAGLLVAASG
jgi:transporter family-2 protein